MLAMTLVLKPLAKLVYGGAKWFKFDFRFALPPGFNDLPPRPRSVVTLLFITIKSGRLLSGLIQHLKRSYDTYEGH